MGPVAGWGPQNFETNRLSRLLWDLIFKDRERVDLLKDQNKALSLDPVPQWYLQDLGHL